MNYKTIRYPGHCAQMRLLMNDLKLNHDRATLKRILENAVPQTLQDVVIVYVAFTGTQDTQLREENYVNKIYPQMIAGRLLSAIQVTTAWWTWCSLIRTATTASWRRNGFACRKSSLTASGVTTPWATTSTSRWRRWRRARPVISAATER